MKCQLVFMNNWHFFYLSSLLIKGFMILLIFFAERKAIIMKKRVIALFCLIVFSLTACKPVTSDKADEKKEEQTIQNFETAYQAISKTEEHIKIDLYKNVHMDADVTPYSAYSEGVGLYNYSINPQNGEIKMVEDTSQVLDKLNNYYGKKVFQETDLLNDSAYFQFGEHFGYDASAYYYNLPMLRVTNNLKLEEAVKDVLTMLEGIADFDICNQYECIYISEEAYRQAEELSADPSFDSFFRSLNNKNFYFVTVRGGKNTNIPIISTGLSFSIKESVVPDNMINMGDSMYVDTRQTYEMIFDENINLISCRIFQFIYSQEDKTDTVKILSSKEMVKILYDHYKNAVKETNIKEMKLYYTVLCTGIDENGLDKYQLAPVWMVLTHEKDEGWYGREFYNAITGEYLLKN